jgi:hypothetical protein
MVGSCGEISGDDMLKSFAAVLRACVVAILRLDVTHTRQIEASPSDKIHI